LNRLLGDPRWNDRENARLRSAGASPPRCWLDGCGRELGPDRRKYCTTQHDDADRQRRQRQRDARLEVNEAGGRYALRLMGNRRPILRREDHDLIFDRVDPGEGRLPGEKRFQKQTHGFATNLRWAGVELTACDRARLDGVVCRTCQRFAVDCAVLTQHQATVIRFVAIDMRSVEMAVRAA
jgi:hypothetical protein